MLGCNKIKEDRDGLTEKNNNIKLLNECKQVGKKGSCKTKKGRTIMEYVRLGDVLFCKLKKRINRNLCFDEIEFEPYTQLKMSIYVIYLRIYI